VDSITALPAVLQSHQAQPSAGSCPLDLYAGGSERVHQRDDDPTPSMTGWLRRPEGGLSGVCRLSPTSTGPWRARERAAASPAGCWPTRPNQTACWPTEPRS